MRDLVGRMGYGYFSVNQCRYCQNRFSDRFLSGPPTYDMLWNLVEHHVHHNGEYKDYHPFEVMIHILASILSCYITKGSHSHYQIYRAMIRHDPEGAIRLLDEDWYCASPFEHKFTPQSLQSFCLRKLLKPFIEDVIREYAAYITWYEMYRTYKLTTGQQLKSKFRRSYMVLTRAARMPMYPEVEQAERNVNPRAASPEGPQPMEVDK